MALPNTCIRVDISLGRDNIYINLIQLKSIPSCITREPIKILYSSPYILRLSLNNDNVLSNSLPISPYAINTLTGLNE